jgi:hypothetical protein
MTSASERWYRVPVVWLGAAVLFASIAGCILMIVLASRYPDAAIPMSGPALLKMPETRPPEAPR